MRLGNLFSVFNMSEPGKPPSPSKFWNPSAEALAALESKQSPDLMPVPCYYIDPSKYLTSEQNTSKKPHPVDSCLGVSTQIREVAKALITRTA